MVDICQKCGDRGFLEALNYCEKCQAYPIHRYCLDVLPKTFDEYVTWFCEDCEKKEVPRIKFEVKFRKTRFVKRWKKKRVKRKMNDDIGSMTKTEAHVGKSSSLQLPQAHCSDKNEDSTLERPGESVREDGAIHREVTTNDISNYLGHNYHVAQPIVDPVWRGSLRFWNKSFRNVFLLVAHMSSLACSKVYDEAKRLPELLSVELLRRRDVWPKGFEKLGPTDQSIALYFFPEDRRSEEAFDILVNAMMCKDLAMRAVLKNAELLVFTSSMLPMDYWRFQMRHYLWGVFRGKQASQQINNVASEDKDLAESLTYPNCDVDLGTDTKSAVDPKTVTKNSDLTSGLIRAESFPMFKLEIVLEDQ